MLTLLSRIYFKDSQLPLGVPEGMQNVPQETVALELGFLDSITSGIEQYLEDHRSDACEERLKDCWGAVSCSVRQNQWGVHPFLNQHFCWRGATSPSPMIRRVELQSEDNPQVHPNELPTHFLQIPSTIQAPPRLAWLSFLW